eukprot:GFYU01011292.1.p1 GENE.GFYU01011292.1~~GFYU01011292.1.p1  ORF type:complete len:361 (+),score=43.30 GFYU01011292.1:40-1083(+)
MREVGWEGDAFLPVGQGEATSQVIMISFEDLKQSECRCRFVFDVSSSTARSVIQELTLSTSFETACTNNTDGTLRTISGKLHALACDQGRPSMGKIVISEPWMTVEWWREQCVRGGDSGVSVREALLFKPESKDTWEWKLQSLASHVEVQVPLSWTTSGAPFSVVDSPGVSSETEELRERTLRFTKHVEHPVNLFIVVASVSTCEDKDLWNGVRDLCSVSTARLQSADGVPATSLSDDSPMDEVHVPAILAVTRSDSLGDDANPEWLNSLNRRLSKHLSAVDQGTTELPRRVFLISSMSHFGLRLGHLTRFCDLPAEQGWLARMIKTRVGLFQSEVHRQPSNPRDHR